MSLTSANIYALTLSGTVTGGSFPLANATISVYGDTTSDAFDTQTTGNDGTYAFSLNAGVYRLEINPELDSGFGPATVSGITLGDNVIRNVALLGEANTLSGTITLPDGRSVVGAIISVYRQTAPYTPVTRIAEDETDATGGYSFELPADTYMLEIDVTRGQIEGDAGVYQYSRAAENLDLSTDLVEDIILPYVTVSGQTTDSNGVPVAGAEVKLDFTYVPPSGYFGIVAVNSDENGNYSFITPAYTYDVVITPPAGSEGLASAVYENVDLTIDSDRDFILKNANTLSGTITLPDGRSVVGAIISVYRQTAPYTPVTRIAEGETDATGGYSFELPADTYMLEIDVTRGQIEGDAGVYQYSRAVENLDLSTDLVEDIILPYVTVSGQTTDSNGVPVAGAEVKLDFTYVPPSGYFGIVAVNSDENGNYSFITPAYTYDVVITPPAGSEGLASTVYENVDLTIDSDRDFILKNANTLSGTITLPDGRFVVGAIISVYRQTAPYTPVTRIAEGETDATGGYSFELPADTYMLEIDVTRGQIEGDAGVYQYSRAVENLDLSTDLVEDIILPYVTVSGQTTDSNGVPVAGTAVELGFTYVPPSGYFGIVAVKSDANGVYTFITPAYTYDVGITPPTDSGFAAASLESVDLTTTTSQDVVLVFEDATPPNIIAGPFVNAIDSTSAVVEWETNEATIGEVIVGDVVISSPVSQRSHSVAVAGLNSDTIYSALVLAFDYNGNGPAQKNSEDFRTKALSDISAPALVEGPTVTAVTQSQASVSWITDEPATTELSYGQLELSQTLSVEGLRTVHEIDIVGLDANTQYSVQISTSDDRANGPTVSELVDFKTLILPDTSAPVVVAGPLLSNITDSEATVVWTTDEPSVSALTLFDGERYEVYSDETMTTDHEMRLTGLQPETSFDFTVSATDAAGNGPTLGEKRQFNTQTAPDSESPVLTSVVNVFAITDRSAQVRWRQDEPVAGIVEYGLLPDVLDLSVSKANLSNNKVVHLSNLLKNTLYYYRVRSIDSTGNESVSEVDSFQTENNIDIQPPKFEINPIVINATSDAVILEWSSNEPTSAVFEYENDAGLVRHNNSVLKNEHRVVLSGLESNQQYPFSVTLSDKQGNQERFESSAASNDISLRSTIEVQLLSDEPEAGFSTTSEEDDKPPEFVIEPSIITASSDKLLLQWSTDEPTIAELKFGESSSSTDKVLANLEYQTQHQIVISNINPEVQYTLSLTATDVAGNVSEAILENYSSLAQIDLSPPEFTTIPSTSDIEENQISINWQADEYAMANVKCTRAHDDASWSSSAELWQISGTLVIAGLDAATEYECNVHIVDLAGNRDDSETVVVRTTGIREDSDSDGVQDVEEELAGTDPLVADTDSDGIEDSLDAFPLDEEESRDTDGDGQGDNADTDDDGDRLPDVFELENGLSPIDPADASADADGDGWANLVEFTQGTLLNRDDNPPDLIVPVHLITESTGALTDVDTGIATAIDAKDGMVPVSADKTGPFEPGRHVIKWTAVDAEGNQSDAQQIVDVVPRISFGTNQQIGEGGKVLIEVLMNGYAIEYPVTVAFDVSGSAVEYEDYEFEDSTHLLTIEEGLKANIEIKTVADSDFQNETIVLTFANIQNAVKGIQNTHQTIISEENISPSVSVNFEQGGRTVTSVTTTGGPVTVTANVTDPNPDDSHIVSWVLSDTDLLSSVSIDENSWIFDPSTFNERLYRVVAEVTDNGEPALTTLVDSSLKTLLQQPLLLEEMDTDGDGLNDALEGLSDTDGDRIPDYLDAQTVENLLPVSRGGLSLQSEPGSLLRLGLTAFDSGRTGARIELQAIESAFDQDTELLPVAELDFEFPAGVFDFEIADIALGATGLVVIPLDTPIAEGAVYRKYSTSFGWRPFIESNIDEVRSAPGGQTCPAPGDNAYTSGLTAGYTCVQLSIEDGGPNDADGFANGIVQDPGGVAVPSSQVPGQESIEEIDGFVDPTQGPASGEIDSNTGSDSDTGPVVTDSGNGPSSEPTDLEELAEQSVQPVDAVEPVNVAEPGEPAVEAAKPTVDSVNAAEVDVDKLPTGSPITDSLESEEEVSETDAVRSTSGGGTSYFFLFGLFLMWRIKAHLKLTEKRLDEGSRLSRIC